jgi:hypothetical protein
MNRADLQTVLDAKNVPRQMYSLDGLKDGECYCVISEGGTWSVVFVERGRKTTVATGLNEQQAYDTVYQEFRSMYGWSSSP